MANWRLDALLRVGAARLYTLEDQLRDEKKAKAKKKTCRKLRRTSKLQEKP